MKYLLNGKVIDTERLVGIYADGRWGSRGVRLFTNSKKEKFFVERWTNWQGEHNTFEELEREAFLELLKEQNHSDRVTGALKELDALEEFMDY